MVRRALGRMLIAASLTSSVAAQAPDDPLRALEQTIATAEVHLKAAQLQAAESRYREAVLEGWMLAGALYVTEGRLPDARDAYRRAATSTTDADAAVRALALVQIQMREADEGVALLTKLAARQPKDISVRQLLTQALLAAGRPEQAVQQLEEAYKSTPGDPELAFLLASGYLRLRNIDAAERLFNALLRDRPSPQTYVLIGRTYRDAGEYGRARASLKAALEQDPRVRRAHYYLGTTAVLEEGAVRLDEAIAEFRLELSLAPDDPVTILRLGMALVEAQQPADALAHLQRAITFEAAPADAFYYLGRCFVALERAADAVSPLERALELSKGPVVDELRLLGIHYQLAIALRSIGRQDAAAVHFTAAEGLSAQRAETFRERLSSYVGNEMPEPLAMPPTPIDVGLSSRPPAERAELLRRVHQALARASFNLGVIHAQAGDFARAAELFESAAAADPEFPQLQYSLGVSYFNAQQYERAIAPLTRVLVTSPERVDARRMLAIASLQAQHFERAAALLADDPGRDSDPALQYAYGVALVRSDRAALAEQVFGKLVAAHGTTPELHVVLGHAHAQQGDYDAAIAELQRALALKPDVAEANGTLGVIYLRQGHLAEAAAALRTELTHHPRDRQAAYTLATVLDLQGQSQEAVTLLRSVLQTSPEYSDARYLLGKILLSQGEAREALAHLEVAARVSPEDPAVQYQLAQAYQKLEMVEQAEQHFEIYRRLKDARRSR